MSMLVRVLVLALFALLRPLSVAAQLVRVTVVDSVASTPVSSAVVTARNPGSGETVYGLTDERGRVAFRLTQVGPWVLSVRRIGVIPRTLPAVDMQEPNPVAITIVVRSAQFRLPSVRVTAAAGACGSAPQGLGRTSALWEQVTLALRAATLVRADSSHAPLLSVEEYERELDRDLTVLSSWGIGRRQGLGRPFSAEHPDSLAVLGYVRVESDRSLRYFAPDENSLLSDAFIRTHCFDTPDSDADPALAELHFRPVLSQRVPDVAGTAYVDAATGELRRISFRFVNTAQLFPAGVRAAGGDVTLRRLSNGQWIVADWMIRMPRLIGVSWSRTLRLAGYREAGGTADTSSASVSPTTSLVARTPSQDVTIVRQPVVVERRDSADSLKKAGTDSAAGPTVTYQFGRIGVGTLSGRRITIPDHRARSVRGTRTANMVTTEVGFSARQRNGIGVFLDSVALFSSAGESVIDLLPRLRVLQLFRVPQDVPPPAKENDIDLAREWTVGATLPVMDVTAAPSATGAVCLVKLYLDGQRASVADLQSLPAAAIAAMEFYALPRDVPDPFRRSGNSCGTVLLWSYAGPRDER